jgi:galactan 5-O-arabinofuranosyltransferase
VQLLHAIRPHLAILDSDGRADASVDRRRDRLCAEPVTRRTPPRGSTLLPVPAARAWPVVCIVRAMNDSRTFNVASSTPRWLGFVGEVVVSFSCAAAITALATTIELEPVVRIGQIAAEARLEWFYALFALPVVAALVIGARVRGGAGFDMIARLSCAAVAGLATGIVAGGIVVALHGTPWGLNAFYGDAGNLIRWTEGVRLGHRPPAGYPPLPFRLMAWYADWFGVNTGYVLKQMQIIGLAVLGPSIYLAWRLVLRPTWALAVGLVASLPMIDAAPYRPYAGQVLLLFVPFAVWFLGVLRRADQLSVLDLARRGAVAGLGMGFLFLTYSGWFQWSAPGFLVALLVIYPWRRAPGRGAVLLGFAAALFAAVSARYLIRTLVATHGMADNYVYFDVNVEPGYIAMWRGDLPGAVGPWPPLGELGGVGLFTALLALGFGASIALARSRTLVITAASLFAGAWLWRFYLAKELWATKLVQLYPRTTIELVYCGLVLTLFAGCLVIERWQRSAPADSPLSMPSGAIGAVCGLLLLFASAGSSISDHYMPNNTWQPALQPGWLAYQAQSTPADAPVPYLPKK